ncbi:hypothetical protein BLNAU_502 [Blattamonas nauphoetae]|uniref:Uncharacterized protein n=1 Tax=Blattamonas nauphoetae TaxID=2049346 RepID=A0ABQ9YLF0_9EUKA|nr:hypothetical protein BLNAU_502 [Blattamonas nauphoetae]
MNHLFCLVPLRCLELESCSIRSFTARFGKEECPLDQPKIRDGLFLVHVPPAPFPLLVQPIIPPTLLTNPLYSIPPGQPLATPHNPTPSPSQGSQSPSLNVPPTFGESPVFALTSHPKVVGEVPQGPMAEEPPPTEMELKIHLPTATPPHHSFPMFASPSPLIASSPELVGLLGVEIKEWMREDDLSPENASQTVEDQQIDLFDIPSLDNKEDDPTTYQVPRDPAIKKQKRSEPTLRSSLLSNPSAISVSDVQNSTTDDGSDSHIATFLNSFDNDNNNPANSLSQSRVKIIDDSVFDIDEDFAENKSVSTILTVLRILHEEIDERLASIPPQDPGEALTHPLDSPSSGEVLSGSGNLVMTRPQRPPAILRDEWDDEDEWMEEEQDDCDQLTYENSLYQIIDDILHQAEAKSAAQITLFSRKAQQIGIGQVLSTPTNSPSLGVVDLDDESDEAPFSLLQMSVPSITKAIESSSPFSLRPFLSTLQRLTLPSLQKSEGPKLEKSLIPTASVDESNPPVSEDSSNNTTFITINVDGFRYYDYAVSDFRFDRISTSNQVKRSDFPRLNHQEEWEGRELALIPKRSKLSFKSENHRSQWSLFEESGKDHSAISPDQIQSKDSGSAQTKKIVADNTELRPQAVRPTPKHSMLRFLPVVTKTANNTPKGPTRFLSDARLSLSPIHQDRVSFPSSPRLSPFLRQLTPPTQSMFSVANLHQFSTNAQISFVQTSTPGILSARVLREANKLLSSTERINEKTRSRWNRDNVRSSQVAMDELIVSTRTLLDEWNWIFQKLNAMKNGVIIVDDEKEPIEKPQEPRPAFFSPTQPHTHHVVQPRIFVPPNLSTQPVLNAVATPVLATSRSSPTNHPNSSAYSQHQQLTQTVVQSLSHPSSNVLSSFTYLPQTRTSTPNPLFSSIPHRISPQRTFSGRFQPRARQIDQTLTSSASTQSLLGMRMGDSRHQLSGKKRTTTAGGERSEQDDQEARKSVQDILSDRRKELQREGRLQQSGNTARVEKEDQVDDAEKTKENLAMVDVITSMLDEWQIIQKSEKKESLRKKERDEPSQSCDVFARRSEILQEVRDTLYQIEADESNRPPRDRTSALRNSEWEWTTILKPVQLGSLPWLVNKPVEVKKDSGKVETDVEESEKEDQKAILDRNRRTLSQICLKQLETVMSKQHQHFKECYAKLFKITRQLIINMDTVLIDPEATTTIVSKQLGTVLELYNDNSGIN